MRSFEFFTAPRIVFGRGTVDRLGEVLSELGDRVLLVLGGHSADESGLADRVRSILPVMAEARCDHEPQAADVDRAVAAGRNEKCNVVVAVGGGSVLDCGKAASGMMTNSGSLVDYLEGIGACRTLDETPLPLVAVPTTAGTGTEVTKNAVITGPGYKKSIRSPLLIPRVALVDSLLTHSLPKSVTSSCGMDALTQLIESHMSRNATPITDALSLEGIRAVGRSLARAYDEPENADARQDMALASLLGGVCLANAGLGAVHGFAAPLGAMKAIPHGVACACLLPQVIRANLDATEPGSHDDSRLRQRFAAVSEALTGTPSTDQRASIEVGLRTLQDLQRHMDIPSLSELGLTETDLPAIIKGSRGSSMRYNPVELTNAQLETILRDAM